MASDPWQDYRKQVIDSGFANQDEFDKQIITLSSSAIGISFVLLQAFLTLHQPMVQMALLRWSWGFWLGSIVMILASYISSVCAHKKIVKQIDDGSLQNDENCKPGGFWNKLTTALTWLGGTGFVLGILFFVLFSSCNLTVTNETFNAEQAKSTVDSAARKADSTVAPASSPAAIDQGTQPTTATETEGKVRK